MYKFLGKKYITRGINARLPPEIVIYLFQLVEGRKESDVPLDYLQIFDLESTTGSRVVVTHRQEEPSYSKKYIIKSDLKIKDKLYIIDDVEYVTMLFASEY